MVVFKCKMCGGTLDVAEGVSVVECEYCGTTQTLPTSHDEVIVNLFNRANNLRLKSEYDKAAEVYDKILDLDNTLAEAHWGVVLCKYGVEYVEDSLMDERIPTCHRTQMESILTDISYQSVLQYADPAAKALYEAQAQEINELQKSILQIVKSEKPFDVFICYKETDFSGERTKDSVIANEIYHELTNSGLKVFFAAITLEDKLGQEYEPYIFAALTSAKVMIVLGTKQEYFNAVWVKNEWSRYLHLMKSDRQIKRTLIPCFRDMDAYDLPNEFSHLQALDMSSIAFMPDLIRNVKKLIEKDQVPNAVTSSSTESSTVPLLRRAFMFLEDGEFHKADELLEKVLNKEPENAKAYLGKLMVEFTLCSEDEIRRYPNILTGEKYFEKAYRFADSEYKRVLEKYNEAIIENQHERKYQSALALMQSKKYAEAAGIFRTIADYKDSHKLTRDCRELENQGNYSLAFSLKHEGKYLEAAEIFECLGDYKDAKHQYLECEGLENQRNYDLAITLKMNQEFEKAATLFEKLGDYKDAKEQRLNCGELYTEQHHKIDIDYFNSRFNNAKGLMETSPSQARKLFQEIQHCKFEHVDKETRISFHRRATVGFNESSYRSAIECMNNHQYEVALRYLNSIKEEYKNVADLRDKCIVMNRRKWHSFGDFLKATDETSKDGSTNFWVIFGWAVLSAPIAEIIIVIFRMIQNPWVLILPGYETGHQWSGTFIGNLFEFVLTSIPLALILGLGFGVLFTYIGYLMERDQ